MLSLQQELELILGPGAIPDGSFASDQERRSAWRVHREELMASVTDFSHPWAFWKFEVGRIPNTAIGEQEFELLRQLDLLTERERTMLAGPAEFLTVLRGREGHNNA